VAAPTTPGREDGAPAFTRTDGLLLAGIVLSGVWELVLIPVTPALVGTHPVLLEALQGSVASMVAAGAFARVGRTALWLALLAPIPGLMVTDPLLWLAGRRWGRPALQWYLGRRPVDRRSVARAESAFRRWGGWTLVGAYYIPVPNAVLYLLAGATGMPLWRFLLLDGAGTMLHIGLCVGLGYAIGQTGVTIATAISRWSLAGAVVLVAGLVAVGLWRSRRGRRAAAG
jgi:membrane-associated protein